MQWEREQMRQLLPHRKQVQEFVVVRVGIRRAMQPADDQVSRGNKQIRLLTDGF